MRRVAIIVIDILIVYLCILLSFQILNHLELLEEYRRNTTAFYAVAWSVVPVYLICAYIFGMLEPRRKTLLETWYTVVIVTIAFTASFTAIIYFFRDVALGFPRSVMLLSCVLYFFGLIIWRSVVRNIYNHFHGVRDALIITQVDNSIRYVLEQKFNNLFNIKYCITESDPRLDALLNEISDIFVADDVSVEIRHKLWIYNNEHPNTNLYFIPKVEELSLINSRMSRFGDLPVHLASKLYLSMEERVVKRIMDVSLSIIALIVFAPFILIAAVFIKLDGGPVFFKQKRLTRNGKRFTMYKLRTMHIHAERHTGPILSPENDHRITKIGALLRATRMDEVPQFWNILKGDISLVGPRPEREFFYRQLEKELPEFRYRLNVKAGLTGLAQVSGKYNTDFKKKLLYDLYYINNFSIFRDILILLQTIKVIFWKENVEGVKISKLERAISPQQGKDRSQVSAP